MKTLAIFLVLLQKVFCENGCKTDDDKSPISGEMIIQIVIGSVSGVIFLIIIILLYKYKCCLKIEDGVKINQESEENTMETDTRPVPQSYPEV